MNNLPKTETLTTAPLRHRLRLELDAPLEEVWALVGDHRRLPEYSAGIERVEVEEGRTRVCHFRPRDGVTMTVRELIRWEMPNAGYATSAEEGGDFGLTNDLSLVTVEKRSRGTLFTWEQHYDHPDLGVMRADFDAGLADIGERLTARFGGRVVERFVDAPAAPTA